MYNFSVTLNKVQDHAHTSWAFQRLLLVNEYSRKSPLPPPFNLIHYICKGLWKIFNSCRKQNFNNNIYGSLDNSSGLDCNLYDTILFNAIDQVKICGYVTEVSVNFSTKPTANQPKIWLFTIQNTNIGTHPNTFQIIEKKMIPLADIQLESGIQTFTQLHIPIRAKQYLAIRFSTGSGNPFSTERNQYYSYFTDEPYRNQKIFFSNSPTTGITMSFNVGSSPGKFRLLFLKIQFV
ncbi:unnamed protein product [Rotaria sp. Silwood1]|nr:unnamed protein product [Rotaria sp. Silwood1]